MKNETHIEFVNRINKFKLNQLSQRDINSISFKWNKKNKDNTYSSIPLKQLKSSHLIRIINLINESKEQNFDYRPKINWINAIKLELSYRDKVGGKALDLIPKLKKNIYKIMVS